MKRKNFLQAILLRLTSRRRHDREAREIAARHGMLEDYKAALGWFEKAAKTSADLFSATYLLKAGVTAEKLGDNGKALAAYKQIKDKYPQSIEGMDIDKYISRIENR